MGKIYSILIKNCIPLACVLFLPTSIFANTAADDKALLTIKLYLEPKDKVKKFSYMLNLPKDEYYSYYVGSDIPNWHVEKDRVIRGEFRSAELVNIRIHSKLNKATECKKAPMKIADPESARIIWKGKLVYGCADNKITTLAEIDNKKYFTTHLAVDNKDKTVQVEITEN